ncbi:putative Tigger transposable element-derived protein 1-like 270 [Homarus americanus]|uniref:Putative Tigger transposable element-derived protein 1-like 270 n=1 Tax=Homarus americanus TaxID=6706 RepID=A0A8J5TA01_HOMAM|nr:putative Tigger transposable element-derived protein 1-like 270 [Homarus americanus]
MVREMGEEGLLEWLDVDRDVPTVNQPTNAEIVQMVQKGQSTDNDLEYPEVTPAETPEVTPAKAPDVTPAKAPNVTPAKTPDITSSVRFDELESEDIEDGQASHTEELTNEDLQLLTEHSPVEDDDDKEEPQQQTLTTKRMAEVFNMIQHGMQILIDNVPKRKRS